MLQNIYFQFGAEKVTEETLSILDEVIQHLKTLENRYFLEMG